MKNDKRRTIDKYQLDYAGDILKKSCPDLCELLEWLESNLSQHETINVHCWYGRLYYIVVEDIRPTDENAYPSQMRIGFTVDVTEDIIYWNNNKSFNPSGGDCFVRSSKWKSLVKARIGMHPNAIHFYKDSFHKHILTQEAA